MVFVLKQILRLDLGSGQRRRILMRRSRARRHAGVKLAKNLPFVAFCCSLGLDCIVIVICAIY
jgi:hypothetical protein